MAMGASTSRLPQVIPTVASLVTEAIERKEALGFSQAELAVQMGAAPDRVSMLSMIKRGKSKLALERVRVASEVLDIDPMLLFAAVIKERSEKKDTEKGPIDPECWPFLKDLLNGVVSQEVTQSGELFDRALRNVEERTGKRVPLGEESLPQLEEFIESQLTI